MPLPIAHGLVGASVVALGHSESSPRHNWKMLLCGAALAISPDFDFFLNWGLHLGRGWHRSFTHSIMFALLLTCLLIAAMGWPHLRDALLYGAAFLSHGLLDFATTKRSGGVELFWPFSADRLKLGVIGLSEFPRGFHLLDMLKASLLELAIFTPLFLAVLLFRRYMPATVLHQA